MNDPLPEDTPPRTEIINHIIKICGFSSDSMMVKYIDQQQWLELEHVVMHGLELRRLQGF
jgi:ribosomal protein S24E